MKKQLLAPFMLLVAPIISNAQIIWNTIEDTLALTPVLFETPGTIKFKDGKFAAGQVTFDPRNKDIYFNDSINSFLFERGQVESVVTNYYGGMTLADAFAGDAYDRFLKQYRTINYDDFNLNKIVYSLAKGSSYTVGPKGNVMIRNEQKLDGKICAVGTSGIKILNSNGDILTL